MESKVCLQLAPKKDYMAPQNVCFPLAVLLTEPLFANWYYSNYLMPIVKLDGVNSLWIDVADSLTYGDGANIYNKIMRISSINQPICAQIDDINAVLKDEISKEYYCVLFLDFYFLTSARYHYKRQHFAHELLLYGYDDERQVFKCYGYLATSYQYVEISYAEVREAYAGAFQYIANGWDKYMLVIMHLYYHGEGYRYPFPNKKFIDKLRTYLQGEVSCEFKCDNLMYLKESENLIRGSGIKISEIFCRYIEMLKISLADTECYGNFSPQSTAFHLYRDYHRDFYERLKYFAEINGLESLLEECIQDYYENVAKPSEIVRMLYIKLEVLVHKKLPVLNVICRIEKLIKALAEAEKCIVATYLDIVDTKNFPEEIV